MPPIKGQSILVLGGSSGIGAGVAKLAAAEGVLVSIASSNPTRVSNAVKAIQNSVPNAQITGYTIDLNTDDVESRLEKLLEEITTTTGRPLDHIITTAIALSLKPLADTNIDFLRGSGQFGLVIPILIAKLAPRFLNQSFTSSLTFTSGRIADRPVKGFTTQAFFAAGLAGLTRALALDLAPVRVNLVSPGATDTEMWGSGDAREQRRAYHIQTALLGKVGSAEEVGEAYIYLLKDTNATGTTVNSSGGDLFI